MYIKYCANYLNKADFRLWEERIDTKASDSGIMRLIRRARRHSKRGGFMESPRCATLEGAFSLWEKYRGWPR